MYDFLLCTAEYSEGDSGGGGEEGRGRGEEREGGAGRLLLRAA